MKELLGKLSSYNIFNNLFPGIIFAVLVSKVTNFNLIQQDILVGAFYYYFIGTIISRIGSLIVEPILKKLKFLNFASYDLFVAAYKKDAKIEILSEVNNMYRTICAVIILVFFSILFEKLTLYFSIPPLLSNILLLFLIFIMFIFAYKKQTSYVRSRVISNQKSTD